jgi:MFS transporter, NNP family, nitrate/nitrite transporter
MFGFDQNQQKVLHLTWFAFFLTFFAWFNLAPFNSTLILVLGFSEAQIKILMIANVALTIPARIFIGPLVDRFGARIVFAILLLFSACSCFIFAQSSSFFWIFVSRLLMGISGAGFVIGIRMVSEWFPDSRMGIAQGIYGGWGNSGAAVSAFLLPWLASFFESEEGWRIASYFSGVLCLGWACVYYFSTKEKRNRNLLEGKHETLRPFSEQDKWLFTFLMAPAYIAMATVVWKLSIPASFSLEYPEFFAVSCFITVAYFYHIAKFWKDNSNVKYESSHKNGQFKNLTVLSLLYSLTFGSQLAVISFFPQFLQNTFGLSTVQAGMWGASFAFMNVFARPAGGWLSDIWGRKRTLVFLIFGIVICYKLMGNIDLSWSLEGAIAVSIICSIFLQAGSGACFAIAPAINKNAAGQTAGIIGAYGNIGAVGFLIAFSFVDESSFFYMLSAVAAFIFFSLYFLDSFSDNKSILVQKV